MQKFYEKMLRPMLSSSEEKMVLISTPKSGRGIGEYLMECENSDCSFTVGSTSYVWFDENESRTYCSQLCLASREMSDNCGNTEIRKQVGGNHYNKYTIEPIDFIHSNNIPYIEANVIKYVVRHRDKNGLEDLQKAKHYIEMLIEREYDS